MGAWLPDEKHYPACNFVTSSPPFHHQAGTRRHVLGRARTTKRKRKGREGEQDQRRGGREQDGGEEEGGGRKSEKTGDKERW